MSLDSQRVKALFAAALEIGDPTERAMFLDHECGADAELRHRLGQLLAATDQPASALAAPFVAEGTVADFALGETAAVPSGPTIGLGEPNQKKPTPARDPFDFTSPVGTTIAGRYKIRQEIGEGGMGSVYLAEQFQPVKRMVALKLIKPGMDTRTVLARFDSERQALAIMDHPNIARVLDAGTTDTGRPFFVMDLVKGIPLTNYCDHRRLDLTGRLALFRQICSAVQHAHQKGIIHRDLKPTNILVEDHDGHPIPKVIDFGLAKATSGMQLSEQSLFTAFGSITGTPLYMAPEQATFNAIDVDTRADIYALGVILYELLTGSTPIRRESLQRAALDEILRVVREDEPPTPSHRISTSEGLPSLAANRHIEPARLGRFVRGDLDWIVMKALAKERNRRYESATGLANDVERFLNDEPVLAGPPTARYRTGKFIRRHRGQVVAAGLVLLALVGGMVGTTFGLFEARRQAGIAETAAAAKDKALQAEADQRRQAERQEREAKRQEGIARSETAAKEKALRAESDQRRQAERRLTQIEKINEILGSIFKNLNPKNAEKEGKPLSALLGERLDQATAAIEGESIGDPLAVARMQMTLGESQRGLGYPEKAIGLFTKCRSTFTAVLGPDHPETLGSMNDLAVSYRNAGQNDRALPLFEQVLALRNAKLGPDHPDTFTSMNNLASSYGIAGQNNRALPLFEQVVALRKAKLGPDHPDTFRSMNNLAISYQATGQNDRALPLLEQVVALRKAKMDPDHPETLGSMNNLAISYQAAGQNDRALPLLEQVLALQKAKLGPDHPETFRSMNDLAVSYGIAGQNDRALPLLEQVVALRKAKLGPDHPETLGSMNNLAGSYGIAGQNNRALPLLEQVVALQKAKLGPDHPETFTSMNNLAISYQATGQNDRALPLFEQVLALRNAKLGPDHPDTFTSMNDLAISYQATGQNDRALPLFEQVVALRKVKLGPDHPETLGSMNNLAGSYGNAGQNDRALPLLEQVLAMMKAKLGPDHRDTLYEMGQMAHCYFAFGQRERGISLGEETVAKMKAKLGPDDLQTLDSMSDLSSYYEASGQLDRAVSLDREVVDAWRRNANRELYARALTSLGAALLKQERWAEAEPALRESLTIGEGKLPDDWKTFHTKSVLGGALLGQKKYAEAGPLLLAGYEGMKQRIGKLQPDDKIRPVEALDRLIELAEATGKPDDAKAWREEKARISAPPALAPNPGAGKP